jgi:hypothetical protein
MRRTIYVNNNVMREWGKVVYDGHLRLSPKLHLQMHLHERHT